MKAEQLELFDSVSGRTCVSGVWGGQRVGCCSAAIFYCIISGRITSHAGLM